MENEILLQVLSSIDGFIGLAVAVWIISIGIRRLDTIQQQYREFMQTVLQQQQQNNNELMKLVEVLCVPAPEIKKMLEKTIR